MYSCIFLLCAPGNYSISQHSCAAPGNYCHSTVLTVVQELLVESWIVSNSFLVPPAQMMQRMSTLSAFSLGVPPDPESPEPSAINMFFPFLHFSRLCADTLLLVNHSLLWVVPQLGLLWGFTKTCLSP